MNYSYAHCLIVSEKGEIVNPAVHFIRSNGTIYKFLEETGDKLLLYNQQKKHNCSPGAIMHYGNMWHQVNLKSKLLEMALINI